MTVAMRRGISDLKLAGIDRMEFYDIVESEFDEERVHFNAAKAVANGWQLEPEIGARLLASLRLGPEDVLLDLGCSTGAFALLAARLAPVREVLGVELSAARCAEARRAAARLRAVEPKAAKVSFLQGDFNAIGEDEIDAAVQRATVAYFASDSLAAYNLTTGEAVCRPLESVPVITRLRPGTRFISLSVLAPEFEMWIGSAGPLVVSGLNEVELVGGFHLGSAYSVRKRRCRLALEYTVLGRE
ncbi:unnamed protein product [Effrenium voratum]|nr:unnamed protein product [Effrenium voratum]